MAVKYELTNETKVIRNAETNQECTLYRICALKDILTADGSVLVRRGALGGFIEKEENLAHEGAAWIFDESMAYGNAHVSENGMIHGSSIVFGNASVCGNSLVHKECLIHGNARVCGNTHVINQCEIMGNAEICGRADIMDYSTVTGNVILCRDICHQYIASQSDVWQLDQMEQPIYETRNTNIKSRGGNIMYNIEIVKTYDNEENSIKGIANLRVANAFEIKGIQIREGKNGLFVSYPSKATGRTNENGTPGYSEIIRPASNELRKKLSEDIMEAYHNYSRPSLVVSVSPVNYENSNIRAYATVTIDDIVQIQGVKLIEDAKGETFVSMPSYETSRNGEKVYVDHAVCLDRITYNELETQVKAAYLSKLAEDKKTIENTQSAEKPAAKKSDKADLSKDAPSAEASAKPKPQRKTGRN